MPKKTHPITFERFGAVFLLLLETTAALALVEDIRREFSALRCSAADSTALCGCGRHNLIKISIAIIIAHATTYRCGRHFFTP